MPLRFEAVESARAALASEESESAQAALVSAALIAEPTCAAAWVPLP